MSGPPGVLLVNLGTPASPQVRDVRRYLRAFLMDGRVLDVPVWLRWLLVHMVIAPFRGPRSARAYQSIWLPAGSPLLVHGTALADGIRRALPGWPVALAMRYGQPGIREGICALIGEGATKLIIVPLYPQGAAATVGSTLAAVYDAAGRLWEVPPLSTVPPFYDDAGFAMAWHAVAAPVLADFNAERVVFSYHGLPERHLRQGPGGAHCRNDSACCEPLTAANARCYRAQCFATTRRLGARLGLDPARCVTAFQSRLGREPWAAPYTHDTVIALARAGVRRVAVLCPAFAADCLETLEEIGIRLRAAFVAAGGADLRLVPSLNAHPVWVQALAAIIRRYGEPLAALPPHESAPG